MALIQLEVAPASEAPIPSTGIYRDIVPPHVQHLNFKLQVQVEHNRGRDMHMCMIQIRTRMYISRGKCD